MFTLFRRDISGHRVSTVSSSAGRFTAVVSSCAFSHINFTAFGRKEFAPQMSKSKGATEHRWPAVLDELGTRY